MAPLKLREILTSPRSFNFRVGSCIFREFWLTISVAALRNCLIVYFCGTGVDLKRFGGFKQPLTGHFSSRCNIHRNLFLSMLFWCRAFCRLLLFGAIKAISIWPGYFTGIFSLLSCIPSTLTFYWLVYSIWYSGHRLFWFMQLRDIC